MSQRHSRVGSFQGRSSTLARRGGLQRSHLLGIAPIVLGIGYLLSRALALAAFGGSAVAFLWGLVIGLAFAVAGTIVLCVTDRAHERSLLGVAPTRESPQMTLSTLAAALAVGLIAAVLL